MKIERAFAPNLYDTFAIKPIRELIEEEMRPNDTYLDPMVRNSPFKDKVISNDIDPRVQADYNLDILDFLNLFDDESVDGVLYDPPYYTTSLIIDGAECHGYEKVLPTTIPYYWQRHKEAITRVLKPGGKAISCSWNSNGMGKKYFRIKRILLVPHGRMKNDTIIMVEVKR